MKTKITITIFTLCCIASFCFAGGKKPPMRPTEVEYFYAIHQNWTSAVGSQDSVIPNRTTTDALGRLYVAGYTMNSTTGADILVVKYDGSGSIVWQHSYSSSGYHRDQATDIALDSLFNVYVTGFVTIDSLTTDYVTLKYDSSGTFQWAETYNGGVGGYNVASSVYVKAGNVYVTGASTSATTLLDYATVKYNASGTQQWASRYDYMGLMDFAVAIIVDDSDHVVVTGGGQTAVNNYDYVTVYYTTGGTQLRVQSIAGGGNGFDDMNALVIDGENNIYMTGASNQNGTGEDFKTIKINHAGYIEWTMFYDYNGLSDIGNDITIGADGNIYVTGQSQGASSGYDFATIAYDSLGKPVVDGTGNGDDIAGGIEVSHSPATEIIVTGTTFDGANNVITIVGYDSSGAQNLVYYYYPTNDSLAQDSSAVSFSGLSIDNNTGTIYVNYQTANGLGWKYGAVQLSQFQYIAIPDTESCPSSFAFYENRGQIVDNNDSVRTDVEYYTTSSYPAIYIRSDTTSFVFSKTTTDTSFSAQDTLERADMFFIEGSRPTSVYYTYAIQPAVPQYLNYFLPQCSDGITNVEGYQRIFRYTIYGDIEIMYSGNEAGGLKYYLICDPYSDPTEIQQEFKADSVYIDSDSALHIGTLAGSMIFNKPVAYEEDEYGDMTPLSWTPSYNVYGGIVSYSVGSYDYTQKLVIEVEQERSTITPVSNPCTNWSSYFNAVGYDEVNDIKTSPAVNGQFVVSGYTPANIFASSAVTEYTISFTSGINTAYLARFTADDVLNWISYYGGNGNESNVQCAWAGTGGASDRFFIAGYTFSTNLICPGGCTNCYNHTTISGSYDGFIAAFDPTGNSLLYGSYITGGGPVTRMLSVPVSGSPGNYAIYIIGKGGDRTNFDFYNPGSAYQSSTTGGDGWVLKILSNTQKSWATMLGFDDPEGMAISDSFVYICGNEDYAYEHSYAVPSSISPSDCSATYVNGGYSDFLKEPTASGHYYQSSCAGGSDFIITKFDLSGDLQWGTYYGGGFNEMATDISIDADDNIYLTGWVKNADVNGNIFPNSTTMMPLPNNVSWSDQITTFPVNCVSGSVSTDGCIISLTSGAVPRFGTLLRGSVGTMSNIKSTITGNQLFLCGQLSDNSMTTVAPYSYYFLSPDYIGAGTDPDLFIRGFDITDGTEIWNTYWGSDGSDYINRLQTDGYHLWLGGYVDLVDNYQIPLFYTGSQYRSVRYLDASSYDLDGYVSELCISSAEPLTVNNVNNKSNNGILVFPDPATDIVTIVLPDGGKDETTIKLYDINGKTALSNIYRSENVQINVSSLPKGFYIGTAESKNNISNFKLVIQ